MEWTTNERYIPYSEMTTEQEAALIQSISSCPWRQTFHIQPPTGLLNDPNGFSFFNGEYHLFYQWFPYGPVHGLKHWYHTSSKDLVNWKNNGVALEPSLSFESHGAYSGSGIVKNDELFLFYTGNVRDENWVRESYQCLAVMGKDNQIKKYSEPIISTIPEGYTSHFRDPKVWKENGQYYAVLGAQRMDETGCILLYGSKDLYEWNLLGEIKTGYSQLGFMWECPDYFEIEGKGILLFCPQGLEPIGKDYQNIYQSGYLLGGKLDVEDRTMQHGEFVELDNGFDFYAPQTMQAPDGRRILVGWMGLPEIAYPTDRNNWAHCLTIPRELTIKENRIYQQPVRELKNLRKKSVTIESTLSNQSKEFKGISGIAYELECDFTMLTASIAGVKLRTGIEEETVFYYDNDKKELVFDRGKSGESFAIDYGTKRVKSFSCKLLKLQIFVDSSSVEIFVNGGTHVFTSRIFPLPDSQGIQFFSVAGDVQLKAVKWDLL